MTNEIIVYENESGKVVLKVLEGYEQVTEGKTKDGDLFAEVYAETGEGIYDIKWNRVITNVDCCEGFFVIRKT